MKATGIVRRIDELGRIVIPKEIRRTLRIREGAPLEIFTEQNGEVILKKFSPIGELSENAHEMVEALSQVLGLPSAITDRDTFIASAGIGKRDLSGRAVSDEIMRSISSRSKISSLGAGSTNLMLTDEVDPSAVANAVLLLPVVSAGDAIGSVLLFSQKPDVAIEPNAQKVLETAASFLGHQIEA